MVRIGQIWADNDSRGFDRKIRVVSLNETHAIVEPVPAYPKGKGKTRIRLDRFKPTSTGYRLVRDVKEKRDGD